MMRIQGRFMIPLMSLICACSTTNGKDQLTAAERERLPLIEIMQSAPNRPFDAVGPVSGEVCRKNAYAVSESARMKEADVLKIQAAKLEADAVIDVACSQVSGISWSKNCWDVTSCTGQAIRFK